MKPVFIADTCIGGLSVVHSMRNSGSAGDAVFLADYAVNPLGTKSDSAIADVVRKWLGLAQESSNTLVIACNTLSIRYHQMRRSEVPGTDLKQVVTMVDCFAAMVEVEADRLHDKDVLVVGTDFTASQMLYPDLLRESVPGVQAHAIGATDLERKIARFQPGPLELTDELTQAIGTADVVALACTCFPIVQAELNSMFPHVLFLDPGAYCPGLPQGSCESQDNRLRIEVTGDVVSRDRVTEFARTYLGDGTIDS